ncbi:MULTISPECIES: MarR family transcriptional regulator [unclassified Aeromicrobium]|uniref:MarR family winged helix-turn-helix transcriptional regulator n=1 Tax=unclassified Aeromicrobium TaxID=2633570 RepID=UPI000B0C6652|nr:MULTISPECIES: MarR family transcriptional regulator [unclassified Aeromicrobium]
MTTDRNDVYERLELFVQRLMSCVHAEGLDQLVELDLSMSQARAMFTVALADRPLAINEIATSIGLSVAAAGRTVDQLVKLGCLERHESPDDRRVKLVALTKRGFDAVDQQMEHKRRALRVVAEQLQPDHAEDLHRVLGQILESDALRVPEKEDHV